MQKVIGIYHTCGDENYGKSGICFIVEKNKEKFMIPIDKSIYYKYDEQVIKENYAEIVEPDIKKALIDEYNRNMMMYMENDEEIYEFPLNFKNDIILSFYMKDREELDENNILNNFVNKIIVNNFMFKIASLSDILLDTVSENNTLMYFIPKNSKLILKTNKIDSNMLLFEVIANNHFTIYNIYKNFIDNQYNIPLLASLAKLESVKQ